MSHQEIFYPTFEESLIRQRRFSTITVVSIIVCSIIIIVIVILFLFFSGSSTVSSAVSTLGNNNNTASSINVIPNAKLRLIGNTTLLPVQGYITVKANSYTVDVLSENKTINSADCIKLCNDDKDCEGVKYSDETCTLFASLPNVKYDGSTPNEVLNLKDDSRPIISDRVFIAGQKSKLLEKEWWNLFSNSDDTYVFTKDNNKTWYISDIKYNVINYGRMTGIYSNKKLTDKQIKDLIDSDIHPIGVECIVDVPYSDNYDIDLSKFNRKTIYVVYL